MRSPNYALPLLVATLGIALFSAMDAYMKSVTLAIGAFSAMFWRNVAGTLLCGGIYALRRRGWPTGAAMSLHIQRGAIGAVMGTTFFYGIARVPLAEGIALSFIAPLITLYLAAVILGETIGRSAIIASVLGLIGVGVMLAGRLGTQGFDPEAWMGILSILVSALFYSYTLILQRRQALVSTPLEVAFFQPMFALGFMALAAPWFATFPPVEQWRDIVLSAVLAMVSLGLLSWAYARAEAQVLVPVEYTAFIWATILGWAMFSEEVTMATMVGTALIVAGCIVAARQKPGGHPDQIEPTAL